MPPSYTDLDVTDLGSSGPRIPLCATGALWGRVTPFSRSLSKRPSSVLGRTELCHEVRNPGPPKPPNHPRRKPPFSRAKEEPQSQKIARTAPKNVLNNSRALPSKTTNNKGFEATLRRGEIWGKVVQNAVVLGNMLTIHL